VLNLKPFDANKDSDGSWELQTVARNPNTRILIEVLQKHLQRLDPERREQVEDREN
jgi:hypothetical protein